MLVLCVRKSCFVWTCVLKNHALLGLVEGKPCYVGSSVKKSCHSQPCL